MATGEQKGNGSKTGFAGLLSMVSDVDAMVKDVTNGSLINSKTQVHQEPLTGVTPHVPKSQPGKALDDTSTPSRGRAFTINQAQQPSQSASTKSLVIWKAILHVKQNWVLYGIGFLIVIGWMNDKSTPTPPRPKAYSATPAPPHRNLPPPVYQTPITPPTAYVYQRPIAAPNGQHWPHSAAYIRGYERLRSGGLSIVTVDNAQNDSDVFVKLVSLDGTRAYPVRFFYIPAHGSFTMHKLIPGSYDIRYRDLNTGGLTRSEAFTLEEIPTSNGVQYSKMTMTLYKVLNGNMHTYTLSESEF